MFNIRYGCSNKEDGTMLVAYDGELFSLGQKNREKFFQKNSIKHWVVCRLAHGTNIRAVTASDDKIVAYGFDGLITNSPNLFLCLTVADCFPVYFWSKEENVIGLAHAGWRGVSGNIVGKMIAKIESEFFVSPENLMTAVGPGIRQCHFEVKEDLPKKFEIHQEFFAHREDKIYFDLVGVIKKQLIGSGILADNITDVGECTYCLPDKYFSHRRDQTDPIEVMLAYIGLEN